MPCAIASFGHSGSHTSQLMHSSVIISAILLPAHLADLGLDARFHKGLDELADVSAQSRDFAHYGGGYEHVLLARGEEQGLDFGVEVPVHACQLELVLEIGNGAQAPHH